MLREGSTRTDCLGPCLVGYNNCIAWIISSSLIIVGQATLDQRHWIGPLEKISFSRTYGHFSRTYGISLDPKAIERKSILRYCYIQKMLTRLAFLPASRQKTDDNLWLEATVHSLKWFPTKLACPLTIQDGVSWFRSSGFFLKELLSWPNLWTKVFTLA